MLQRNFSLYGINGLVFYVQVSRCYFWNEICLCVVFI